MSAREFGELVGKTSRTIERHIAEPREQGRIRREGSAKAGHWVVPDD